MKSETPSLLGKEEHITCEKRNNFNNIKRETMSLLRKKEHLSFYEQRNTFPFMKRETPFLI